MENTGRIIVHFIQCEKQLQADRYIRDNHTTKLLIVRRIRRTYRLHGRLATYSERSMPNEVGA